ncbi:60S ribosomal protein L27a [Tupaia chinensis]|uniref:Large ribosomal subunit protein uL15 n=1 Tax=Tupaia chinensis TaxID=246437 RepID=L9LB61_TUPCH|nr:60S ribosomal protein L27a [Tupaia chinensis]
MPFRLRKTQKLGDQGQLRQISPRLLWESWYEALPLKEEPVVNLDKLWTLESEQTLVKAARDKTRAPSVTDVVPSDYYKVVGKEKFPKQAVMVSTKFFSRRAEEKIESGGDVPGQLRQISPRLLWESWYEALPLKEEPVVNLDKLWTLESEQTLVKAARDKTRAPSVTDVVPSDYYKVVGKEKFPKQAVMVSTKFFSRRAEEKIESGGDVPVA